MIDSKKTAAARTSDPVWGSPHLFDLRHSPRPQIVAAPGGEHWVRAPASYWLSVAITLAAIAVQALLSIWLPLGPYVSFFIAIIVVTFLGGRGPGLLALALGGLFAWYFFVPPVGWLGPRDLATNVALIVYVLIGTTFCLIIHRLQSTITELHATVQVQRQTASRLRAIMDNAVDGLVTIEDHGIVTSFSRSAERIFGYLAEEVVGRNVKMLMPSPFHEEHDGYVRNYLETGNAKIIGKDREVLGRRKDGSIFPMDLAVGEKPKGSGPRGFVASVRDITERKRAEQVVIELQRQTDESAALLETVMASAPVGIAIFDRADKLVKSNPAMVPISGVALASQPGLDVAQLVPGLWSQLEEPYRSVISTGLAVANIQVECEAVLNRGKARHLIVSYYPIRFKDEFIGVGTVIIDISSQKLTERALRQSQKMESLGNLTGGIAHDFNNLLGIIVGNLSLAKPKLSANGEMLELIDESLGAAWRGADLTRRLLAYARLQPLHPRRASANELITGMAKLLDRSLGDNIRISLQLANELWPIEIDTAQFEASVVNLATNARDAMPKGGCLTIATSARRLDAAYAVGRPEVVPGDYVMIEVTDTGTGMTPDVMEHIFEPFFTTKEVGKGTGLGLSMVFGFIKQSGGHINVYSEPGKGTTFRIYLPRAHGEVDAQTPLRPVAAAKSGDETVLVVEDNAALRIAAVRQLRELGYRTFAADGADSALVILDRERIDLLFTDVAMPGSMDGPQLVQVALDRWPRLKALLTSGFPGVVVSEHFGVQGVTVQLLSKPYRLDELATAIRQTLDS